MIPSLFDDKMQTAHCVFLRKLPLVIDVEGTQLVALFEQLESKFLDNGVAVPKTRRTIIKFSHRYGVWGIDNLKRG